MRWPRRLTMYGGGRRLDGVVDGFIMRPHLRRVALACVGGVLDLVQRDRHMIEAETV